MKNTAECISSENGQCNNGRLTCENRIHRTIIEFPSFILRLSAEGSTCKVSQSIKDKIKIKMDENKGLTTTEIVLIAVGAVVVVAIVVVMVVLVLSRNKKKKNEISVTGTSRTNLL